MSPHESVERLSDNWKRQDLCRKCQQHGHRDGSAFSRLVQNEVFQPREDVAQFAGSSGSGAGLVGDVLEVLLEPSHQAFRNAKSFGDVDLFDFEGVLSAQHPQHLDTAVTCPEVAPTNFNEKVGHSLQTVSFERIQVQQHFLVGKWREVD